MSNYLSRDQVIGLAGERWVYEQLVAKGYEPAMKPQFGNSGYDMLVRGLPVEVKFANKTERKRTRINQSGLVVERWYPRWQWLVHPTSHELQDWVLILVAEDYGDQRYPYIVPGGVLLGRTHIQITSHPTRYNGWLAQWLNRWEIIDYLADKVYQNNGPLFSHYCEQVVA